MPKYINADNLLTGAQDFLKGVFFVTKGGQQSGKTLALVERLVRHVIQTAPAEDVEPVVHGQNISPLHPVDEFECSKCGLILRDWSEVKIDEDELAESYYEFEFKYCPNCGAKMDETRRGNYVRVCDNA